MKSNLDFMQLLSYANVNLHVTRFMDSGNGEVHVDFGTGFLPSIGPSVFTFITKWEYLDQILIKKMVVPISPVPISKCSLDNLPLPIKIGDKVLFQNRHTLLKYFKKEQKKEEGKPFLLWFIFFILLRNHFIEPLFVS